MFNFDQTIWICQCCGYRTWVDCKITDGDHYRCPNCNHAAPIVNLRKRDYAAEAEMMAKLDKGRPG